MLLTIIPFVLAARFALDENYEERYRWRYGSASLYDVSVNLSQADFGENLCSTISGELECQPRDSESLGCRFLNGLMTSWSANDSTGCQQSRTATTRDRFFDREPFEIRFHSRGGIENLVVRRTIPRWRLNVIKAVVAQLDISSELDKGPSWFVTVENSTFGTCAVESKIFITGDSSTESENEFDMVLINSSESSSTDVLSRNGNIIIEKIRRPEKCPGRATYFFGYASKDEGSERGTFLEMVSSLTRTTISKKSFSSQTRSEGSVVVAADGSTIGRARQAVTLTLKSVHPARSNISAIANPASTGLYAPSTPVNFFSAVRRVLTHLRKPVSTDRRSPPIARTSRTIQL